MKKYLLALCFIVFVFISYISRANAAPTTLRLAGEDRYKTAVEISKSGWTSAQTVVLSTGENFPDALCSAPLARQLNAPILLTGKSTLNNDTAQELDRLKTKKVLIIGGPGVIDEGIKNQLEAKSIFCTRLWGSDRYETSIAVANYMANNFKISTDIVAVAGEDFPDALSASPIAAQKGMPVILVPKDYIPSNVISFIYQMGIKKTYIVGGNDIISNSAAQQLPGYERIYGVDKYDRNIAVLNKFNDSINSNTIYVATGEDFPDALAGSALASLTSSPIVLTGKIPSQISKFYIDSKLPLANQLKVLGGEGVLPIATIQTLRTVNKSPLKVHYLDVGQGDSILVQTPAGKNMLIDASNNGDGDAIVTYLKTCGVQTLDVVVGTQPYEDHIGGLDTVIKNFNVGKIYLPKVSYATQSYMDLINTIRYKGLSVTNPEPGKNIDLGPYVTLEALAPNSESYAEFNDYSIVLKLYYGSHSFLFTGDAGKASEKEMLKYNLSSTVLKVGQHGGDGSTSMDFLNAVNPSYAIISVGRGNEYGDPDTSTMMNLEKKGTKIYRTDENGTIVFTSDSIDLSLETLPGKSLRPIYHNTNNSEVFAEVGAWDSNRDSGAKLSVTGPAGGKVTAICHYRNRDLTYIGTINLNNQSEILIPLDENSKGYRVDIDITVSLNGKVYSTRTSFIP